jgi:hypothetical protein
MLELTPALVVARKPCTRTELDPVPVDAASDRQRRLSGWTQLTVPSPAHYLDQTIVSEEVHRTPRPSRGYKAPEPSRAALSAAICPLSASPLLRELTTHNPAPSLTLQKASEHAGDRRSLGRKGKVAVEKRRRPPSFLQPSLPKALLRLTLYFSWLRFIGSRCRRRGVSVKDGGKLADARICRSPLRRHR